MPFLLSLLLIVSSVISSANTESLQFDNAYQESQYRKLISELRCLVCQNQNIADSNADLAKDLRIRVYELIKAGKNDEQISSYMTQRYGDFVLYNPPFTSYTLLLWFGPACFLVLAWLTVYKLKLVGEFRNDYGDAESLPMTDFTKSKSESEIRQNPLSVRIPIALLAIVFLSSFCMYLLLGDPEAQQKKQFQAKAIAVKNSIPELVQYLMVHPEDRLSWLQLAESYRFLHQDALADQVLQKIHALGTDNSLPRPALQSGE